MTSFAKSSSATGSGAAWTVLKIQALKDELARARERLEVAKTTARASGETSKARQIKREQRRLRDKIFELDARQREILAHLNPLEISKALERAAEIAQGELRRLERINTAITAAQTVLGYVERIFRLIT